MLHSYTVSRHAGSPELLFCDNHNRFGLARPVLDCQDDVSDLVQPFRDLLNVLELAARNLPGHSGIKFLVVLGQERPDEKAVHVQAFTDHHADVLD